MPVNALSSIGPRGVPGMSSSSPAVFFLDDAIRFSSAFAESIIRHGIYNLGGGAANSLTLRELLTRLEDASGLQAVIGEESSLPAPVPFNYVTDLGLIAQELGWKPEIGLDEGLKTLF